MAHLIAYAQMSTTDNAIAGNLVKAQCDLCGKKYGSLEEAKKCEARHIEKSIAEYEKQVDALQEEINSYPPYEGGKGDVALTIGFPLSSIT